LRLVGEGETVLVTDRGKVIAQILPPPMHAGVPRLQEALDRLARTGRLRLGVGAVPSAQIGPSLPTPSGPVDAAALLADVRADRP
jgi:hypothetical protein